MGAHVYKKHLTRNTWKNLVPTESFDEETFLFTMADGYIGFGFVSKPLPGGDESVTQRLSVLFSFDYPKESFIQVMLMGSQDIQPVVDGIKRIRKSSSPALKNAVNRQIQLLEDGTKKSPSLHAQAYVREYKVVFTVKIPISDKNGLPKPNEIASARDLRISFEQTLKSAGLHPRAIDAEDYLRLLGQILHWSPDANWRSYTPYYDDSVPINEQVSEFDDMMEVDNNGIWLGEKRLRIMSPLRLKGEMALSQIRRIIGDPLNGSRGIHGNFFINMNIFIPDNATEKQKAERERGAVNYQAFGPMLKFNPKLALKKEAVDDLFTAITEGDRILKINLCIGLFADTLEQSETRLTEAQTYLTEIGWGFKEDKFITLPMLVNSLPFCADSKAVMFLQRYKRLAGRHVVEFLPVVSDWSGTGTPMLTFISRAGQIMNMDIFDSNTNYNTVIAAASGSGKSFLTNYMITSYISSGAKCWTIDVGRSYEKICNELGGDFIEFGEDSQICMSPFQIVRNYNEDADMLVGIIMSMAALNDPLSDLQQAKLRSILKDLWDTHGKTMMVDHVADRLCLDDDQRVADMGHQLFAFTSKGEYGRFFNGENNIHFNNPLTCLELEELKGRAHLQQVVLLILIYQIGQEMYLGNRDQRKILLIDEAWDLLAQGNIAKFIETGYRRFRKYNGAAITITQSMNDLYSSSSGVAIAENSANMYLLYQKPETIESIRRQNRLMIGDGGFEFLKSVHTVASKGGYSEIFFLTSYGAGIGRLIVDRYTLMLYSTHPDHIKMIKARTDAGMTTDQAIRDIIDSENQ